MTQELVCYKTMPIWNQDTIPEMVTQKHNTKVGTWAKPTVLKGDLKFYVLDEDGNEISEHVFNQNNPAPYVEPQLWHRVAAASDELEFYLEFYCQKEDYFAKKYNLTKTHSEVLNATQYIQSGTVLDLGCGQGRNSLYLGMLGFDVTAYDRNQNNILVLNDLIEKEKLANVHASVADICHTDFSNNYDFIVATVVFQFIAPQLVPALIQNMQQHTKIGGYNLIVAPMSTDAVPCPLDFAFTFKQDELKQYYAGWEFAKYNENMGELHKTDPEGNRYKMQFVTMLAKRIS